MRGDQLLSGIKKIDERVAAKLCVQDQKSLKFRVAAFFAHSGDSWLWCGVLLILWFFSAGDVERTIAYWGLSIAITAVLVFFLKKLIKRERPAGDWGRIYRKGDPHSFPSGHAVRAGLIIVLAFSSFGAKGGAIFLIWGVLMALSRIATGLHYYSDVSAGMLLGVFIGLSVIAIQPWVYRNFAILFDKSQWIYFL